MFNGDQLTFINFLGLVMCFTGIIAHVAFKFARSKREIEASVATVTHSCGSHCGPSNRASTSGGIGQGRDLIVKDDEVETPLLHDSKQKDEEYAANSSRSDNDL